MVSGVQEEPKKSLFALTVYTYKSVSNQVVLFSIAFKIS